MIVAKLLSDAIQDVAAMDRRRSKHVITSVIFEQNYQALLTHCGVMTDICVTDEWVLDPKTVLSSV